MREPWIKLIGIAVSGQLETWQVNALSSLLKAYPGAQFIFLRLAGGTNHWSLKSFLSQCDDLGLDKQIIDTIALSRLSTYEVSGENNGLVCDDDLDLVINFSQALILSPNSTPVLTVLFERSYLTINPAYLHDINQVASHFQLQVLVSLENEISVDRDCSLPLIKHSMTKGLGVISNEASLQLNYVIEHFRGSLKPDDRLLDNKPLILTKIDVRKKFLSYIKIVKHFFDWVKETMTLHDNWNIGLIKASPEELLKPNYNPEINWLFEPNRKAFRADPFGIKTNDSILLMYEYMDYKYNKGIIYQAKLNLDTKLIEDEKLSLEIDNHLSYPYLIEDNNEVYCIPESAFSNEVTLYKMNKDSDSWQKVKTLVQGYAALDSSVIQHNGYWWLFCSDLNDGPFHKLNIFYSKNLEDGWQPHLKNPVKVDVRSSRPGGTPFVYNDKLYRPAQDNSVTYGGNIAINEVLRLSPEDYYEQTVSEIKPQKYNLYKNGIHTLSSLGDDYWLVDGKRFIFNPVLSVRKMKARIKGLFN